MALTTYTIAANTPYANVNNQIGLPDLGAVYTAGLPGSPFSSGSPLPSVTTESQLGQLAQGWSKDSILNGYGTFIFLAVPTSTTVTPGLLYNWDGAFNIAAVSTTMAGGIPIAVGVNTVASNANSIQYTWFQVQGLAYVLRQSANASKGANLSLYVGHVTGARVQTTASTLRSIIGIRGANLATLATSSSALPAQLDFPCQGPSI